MKGLCKCTVRRFKDEEEEKHFNDNKGKELSQTKLICEIFSAISVYILDICILCQNEGNWRIVFGDYKTYFVGWKVGNSGSGTHPAGCKKPNELGIYDMTGNVSEWCADWYVASWYQVSPVLNPVGPFEGVFRVMRGGSWFYDHSGLTVTDRESANPTYSYGYVGFRLCRSAVIREQEPRKPPTRANDSTEKIKTYLKKLGL